MSAPKITLHRSTVLPPVEGVTILMTPHQAACLRAVAGAIAGHGEIRVALDGLYNGLLGVVTPEEDKRLARLVVRSMEVKG